MATETFTNYPLPPWAGYRDDALHGWADQQIANRLGAIEERLSRIEAMLSKMQPRE